MAQHLIEDVVPGRATGLFDIDGIPLFDGDEVVNLNAWDTVGRVQLMHAGAYTFWSAGGASIETVSSHPRFGVRKLPR